MTAHRSTPERPREVAQYEVDLRKRMNLVRKRRSTSSDRGEQGQIVVGGVVKGVFLEPIVVRAGGSDAPGSPRLYPAKPQPAEKRTIEGVEGEG